VTQIKESSFLYSWVFQCFVFFFVLMCPVYIISLSSFLLLPFFSETWEYLTFCFIQAKSFFFKSQVNSSQKNQFKITFLIYSDIINANTWHEKVKIGYPHLKIISTNFCVSTTQKPNKIKIKTLYRSQKPSQISNSVRL